MSKTPDQFFPWFLHMVPGVPDPLAQQAVRTAAIAFCIATDIVQRVITADLVASTDDYTLTAPTDMKLARVLSVSSQGMILAPASPDLVASDIVLDSVTIGAASPVTGTPTYFYTRLPDHSGFSLYPIPATTVTSGLTVKASFAPTNAAATLDDTLWDDWVDVIGAGAAAVLMSMPGQAFSNASQAPVFAKAFQSGVTRAKRVKVEGYLPGPTRVTPRRFA